VDNKVSSNSFLKYLLNKHVFPTVVSPIKIKLISLLSLHEYVEFIFSYTKFDGSSLLFSFTASFILLISSLKLFPFLTEISWISTQLCFVIKSFISSLVTCLSFSKSILFWTKIGLRYLYLFKYILLKNSFIKLKLSGSVISIRNKAH